MSSISKSLKQPPGWESINREWWLTEVARLVASLFHCELKDKPYRVTCGFPSINALGAKSRRVGECHSLENSKGKVHEIFISPLLDDPLEVAGTLTHELAHVAAGVRAAHGKEFVSVCKFVGLTQGKPRSIMPGPLLNEKLSELLADLPHYPHQALVPTVKQKAARTTNISLLCSAKECGCKVTIASRWLDEIPSLPTCGCGQPFKKKSDASDEELDGEGGDN